MTDNMTLYDIIF